MLKRTRLLSVAVATTLAMAALTGCSSSTSAPPSNEPVTLSYWDPTPGMDVYVQDWNKTHPLIQVKFTKINGGEAGTQKFLTAIKAGTGAPDVVLAEYQKIPSLVAAGALADISKDVSPDLKSQFSTASWDSVTLGSNALYAVPQNYGPMLFFYRADIFDKMGLTVPKTWDEYATLATKVKAADPSLSLGTWSPKDSGGFAGISQQNGASWWTSNGDTWGVNIDEPATQKVTNFWAKLVVNGSIPVESGQDPNYFTDVSKGKILSLVAGAWMPAVLAALSPTLSNKFKVAELPQWNSSDAPTTGTYGGSAVAVSSQSKYTAQAAQFVEYMNGTKEGLSELEKVTGGLLPSNTKYASDVLTTPPPYFATSQPDYWQLAIKAATEVKPFTYGPNVDATYNSFSDQFQKAVTANSVDAFAQALSAVQQDALADLKSSGFKVK